MDWPNQDDRSIAREMTENPNSPEWLRCRAFLMARIKRVFGGGCPEHLKEDIVQETLIKVVRSLGTFSYQYPLAAWLVVILTRTAIDCFRRERKEKANVVSLDILQDAKEGYEVAAQTRDLEEHCITSETINEMASGYREWLNKKPKNAERDFDVWRLHVLLGQEAKHIADCLKIDIQIVYRIIRKAKQYFSEHRHED